MAFKKPDPQPNFTELEKQIADFWQENNVFQASVEQRKGQPDWRFYDGPPFISGNPHYGHIKDFVVKDIMPRYWTMKGFYAPRVWGWDAHGLPVENKVEKKLGIRSKLEVEQMGIAKYIEECYNYTRGTSAEWPWYIKRIGRWIDYDHAYRTMNQDYMESVWWVFKSLWEKDLIYKGWRSSLYSTDSATPVSNFEIAMDNTYEDVEDDAVTVKFELNQDAKFSELFAGHTIALNNRPVFMLSWTTTPWTLSANFALAVNPDEEYALTRVVKENVGLKGVWQVNELPFDFNKLQQVKIESYLISDQGEEVTDEELVAKSKLDASHLIDLQLKALKIGKKFYYAIGEEELKEVDQGTYQRLTKLAKATPEVMTRYYYPLTGDANEGDLTHASRKNQLQAEIDIYGGEKAGQQLVSVEFDSPMDYQSFKTKLPGWFGTELSDFKASNASQDMAENYQFVLLANNLLEQNIRGEYEVLAVFPGKMLAGLSYKQLYTFLPGAENDFKVYTSMHVTIADGTGVLHVAPAFGEEDFEIGKEHGLSFKQCIDDAGNMLPETGPFAGKYLREVAAMVIHDLRQRSLLYRAQKYVHRLPFYRYENPLIYRAQDSWFINVQKLKPELFAQNEKINWVPDHLKEGRFKKGIETAPDWSISRSRFWSTSMPVWVEADPQNPDKPAPNFRTEDALIVGSRDELKDYAVQPVTKLIFVNGGAVNLGLNKQLAIDFDKLVADFANKYQPEHFHNLNHIVTVDNTQFKAASEKLLSHLKSLQGNDNLTMESANDLITLQDLEELAGTINRVSLEDSLVAAETPEADKLRAELDSLTVRLKQKLNDYLARHAGKSILLILTAESIALIKHIFEGASLTECFAGAPDVMQKYTMYFLHQDGAEQPIRLLDLHRPVIDQVKLKHPVSGKNLVRIPEVLDVWMDSGSMPYAQLHYPFENRAALETGYPADFIVEYIAQTRAWFYVMHVLGVALTGQNAFKNVVTSGVIFGTDGRKMSKTYGNYPDPKQTLEKYGAEAMRWYFASSKLIVGEDINFDEKGLRDQLRLYLLPIWNIYSFFTTYANLHGWTPTADLLNNKVNSAKQVVFSVPGGERNDTYWYQVPLPNVKNKLDIWLMATLQKVTHQVRAALDDYNIPEAARKLQSFTTSMSKWYVRLSRSRFTEGDSEAFSTLYHVLVELLKLTAPFTPFIAENLYKELVTQILPDQQMSIHLADYPEADIDYWEKNAKLLEQMDLVSAIVDLGQSLRTQHQLKVRQPLAELEVSLRADHARDWELEQWMKDLIAEELNINKVEERHTLQERSGWLSSTSPDGLVSINLDTNLTEELKRAGIVREVVRSIQSRRKSMQLQLEDLAKIEIFVNGNDDILKALQWSIDNIKSAVNAAEVILNLNKPHQLTNDLVKLKISDTEVYLLVTKIN